MPTNEFTHLVSTYLVDIRVALDESCDYAYGRMMAATEPDEAEHYEALLARRTNRAAVAQAEIEGY